LNATNDAVQPFAAVKAAHGAFALAGQHIPALAQTVVGWILIQIAVAQATYWGIVWMQQSDPEVAAALASVPLPLQGFLTNALPTLVTFVAYSAIAVTWHRFVLLEERPRGLVPLSAWRTARYVGRVLLLAGVVGVILLLTAVVLAIVGSRVLGGSGFGIVIYFLPLVVWLLMMFLLLRTGLAFPATAIDDQTWTLERSWHRTEGNSLRLFGGLLLVALPFYAFTLVFGWLGATLNEPHEWLISHLINAASYAVNSVSVVLMTGYYANAFSFFAVPDGKGRAAASHFS